MDNFSSRQKYTFMKGIITKKRETIYRIKLKTLYNQIVSIRADKK